MKGYLILEDGNVFEGEFATKITNDVVGKVELCSSMIGFQDVLSSNDYKDKIVICTFPIIGATGQLQTDNNNDKLVLKGLIAREICNTGSNFLKTDEFANLLEKNNITTLQDIDTRHLTQILRDKKGISATITTKKPNKK